MSMMVSYDVTKIFGHRAIPVFLFCIVIIGLTTVGLHISYEAFTNRDFDSWRPFKKVGATISIVLGIAASITLGSHGVFVFSKYNEIQKQELAQIKHNLQQIKEKKDTIITITKNSYLNKLTELKSTAITELNDYGAGEKYENRVVEIEKFTNGKILPLPNRIGQTISSKEYKDRCIIQLNENINAVITTWKTNFDTATNNITKSIDSDEYASLISEIDAALKEWNWDDWNTSSKAKNLIIQAYSEYDAMVSIIENLKSYCASANKLMSNNEQIQVSRLDNPPASVVLSKWSEYWRHGFSGFDSFSSLVDKPKGVFIISILFAMVFELFYIIVFVAFYRQRSY